MFLSNLEATTVMLNTLVPVPFTVIAKLRKLKVENPRLKYNFNNNVILYYII